MTALADRGTDARPERGNLTDGTYNLATWECDSIWNSLVGNFTRHLMAQIFWSHVSLVYRRNLNWMCCSTTRPQGETRVIPRPAEMAYRR
jgi:hypothetical protein